MHQEVNFKDIYSTNKQNATLNFCNQLKYANMRSKIKIIWGKGEKIHWRMK